MKNKAYELENQNEAVDQGVLSRDETDGSMKRAEAYELQPVDLSAYLAIEDPEVQVRLVQQLVRVLEFPKDMAQEDKFAQAMALLKSVRDVPRGNGLEEAQVLHLVAMHDAVMKAWARAANATSLDLALKYSSLAARLTTNYDKVLSSMERRTGGEPRESTVHHHHTVSLEAREPMLNITPGQEEERHGTSAKAILHVDDEHRLGLSAEVLPKKEGQS